MDDAEHPDVDISLTTARGSDEPNIMSLPQDNSSTYLQADRFRAALDKLRMEHEDFHFAQDLARSSGSKDYTRLGVPTHRAAPEENSPLPVVKARKRQKVIKPKANDNGGIERFFSRK